MPERIHDLEWIRGDGRTLEVMQCGSGIRYLLTVFAYFRPLEQFASVSSCRELLREPPTFRCEGWNY
jgi:hypothetical protein